MLGEVKERATIRDVASRAGVSSATVSYVINGKGGVGTETRERVLAAAAELGFRPDAAARRLATRRTGLVAVVVGNGCGHPGLTLTFFGRVLEAISRHLPESGYLVAAALHRGWIDPLVVIRALPAEPRPWFIGSGPSTFDRRWKETLLRRVGGILPVWRGGVSVDEHVAATRAVVDAGCPYVIFIEGGTAGPPDRLHRVRSGVGLAALRLDGMPIVPFALAGSDDLYRGKRIGARIGPPITAAELLGDAMPARPPEPGSREELRLARLVTERLAERIEAAVAEMYPGTVDPPEAARPWRWLRRLF